MAKEMGHKVIEDCAWLIKSISGIQAMLEIDPVTINYAWVKASVIVVGNQLGRYI